MAELDHVDETVEQLFRLYERQDQRTGRVQRIANRITVALARPVALVAIFGVVLAWTIGNMTARAIGSPALEEFPFPDLGFILTVAALLVALLILTTQRHEEEQAERRARLTLHIAALSEKKIAKVIALLEEQRRDNPLLPSRHDPEATRMAVTVDPASHLEHLEKIDEAMEG